ncbi:MAG: metal-dependent hydrolase [Pseudomonadota bacterium]
MHDIPVRKMSFDIPTADDLDPKWLANDIVQSYFSTGISLYVAYLEPFLVKSMRRVLDQITDDKLRENVDRFARQEAQHYTQHEKFNNAILGKNYPGLQARFDILKQDFEDFLAHKGDKWCVGFVEGFEALTTQIALRSLHQLSKQHARTDPRFAALFEWHMAEEVEHRTVAYDIYEHLYGDYLFRVKMCWFAQHHILKFISDCMKIMSPVDTARYDDSYHVPRVAYPGMWAGMAPAILKTMTPWYTPHHYAVPDTIEGLSTRLSDQATSVS